MPVLLTLRIKSDNEAFYPDPRIEVVRVLTELAERLAEEPWPGPDRREGVALRDVNGNPIGSCVFGRARK